VTSILWPANFQYTISRPGWGVICRQLAYCTWHSQPSLSSSSQPDTPSVLTPHVGVLYLTWLQEGFYMVLRQLQPGQMHVLRCSIKVHTPREALWRR